MKNLLASIALAAIAFTGQAHAAKISLIEGNGAYTEERYAAVRVQGQLEEGDFNRFARQFDGSKTPVFTVVFNLSEAGNWNEAEKFVRFFRMFPNVRAAVLDNEVCYGECAYIFAMAPVKAAFATSKIGLPDGLNSQGTIAANGLVLSPLKPIYDRMIASNVPKSVAIQMFRNNGNYVLTVHDMDIMGVINADKEDGSWDMEKPCAEDGQTCGD